MCAIRFLRLEDFLNPNNEISGMIVHLEPQGVLFADVRSFVHLSFSPSSSSSLDQIHQSLSQTSSEIKTTEEIIHQTQRSERKREREGTDEWMWLFRKESAPSISHAYRCDFVVSFDHEGCNHSELLRWQFDDLLVPSDIPVDSRRNAPFEQGESIFLSSASFLFAVR